MHLNTAAALVQLAPKRATLGPIGPKLVASTKAPASVLSTSAPGWTAATLAASPTVDVLAARPSPSRSPTKAVDAATRATPINAGPVDAPNVDEQLASVAGWGRVGPAANAAAAADAAAKAQAFDVAAGLVDRANPLNVRDALLDAALKAQPQPADVATQPRASRGFPLLGVGLALALLS